MDEKAPDAFRTISEVADELDLPQHVLRFWESRFREIKPMKRGGGRRFYRRDDIDLLRGIRHLLYGEGYTIRGVQRILREQGVKFVQSVWEEGAVQPPHGGAQDDDVIEETAAFDESEELDETVEVEDVKEADEVEEETGGLRGRLGALIGRDLGDRLDDATTRRDPPMQSAPMPRISPDDRLLREPAVATPSVEPRLAAPPQAAAPAPRAYANFGPEQVRKLQTALQELTECRKLIDAAVARPE